MPSPAWWSATRRWSTTWPWAHHDAEEVTQTAFFKAWQGLPSFQGKAAFSSWLYRLTVNAAIDLLRQRKKHQGVLSLDDPDLPVVPDRGPSPEELSEEHERRQLLWQAIESLPEPHRIPLLLREIEGLSYREIAQALDLEEGTVKSRLARARLLLRKLLLQRGTFPPVPRLINWGGKEGCQNEPMRRI